MPQRSKTAQARQFAVPVLISILLHLVSGAAVLLAFPSRPMLSSHEPGKALMVFFPDLTEKKENPPEKPKKKRPPPKPRMKKAPVVKKSVVVAKKETPPKPPPPPEKPPAPEPKPPEPEKPVENPVMPPPVKKDLSVAKPESPKTEPEKPSAPVPPPPEAPPEKPAPVVAPPVPPEPPAPEPPEPAVAPPAPPEPAPPPPEAPAPKIPEPVIPPPVAIPEPDQPVEEPLPPVPLKEEPAAPPVVNPPEPPSEEPAPPPLVPEVTPVETAPPPVPERKPEVTPAPIPEQEISLRSIEPDILTPEKKIFFPMAETKIPMRGPMIARETGHPKQEVETAKAEAPVETTAEPAQPLPSDIRPEAFVIRTETEVRAEATVPERPVVAEAPKEAATEENPPPVEAPEPEPVPEPAEVKEPEKPREEAAPETPPETVKAPDVAITEPREGETVSIVEGGSVTIRGSVDDPTVETATVIVNGERREVAVKEGRFELQTKGVERQNTISVEATNRAGVRGSSPLLKFFTALFKPPDVLAILNASSACRGLKLRLFKGEHPRSADYRPFTEPKEMEIKTEPVDSDPSSWSVMAMVATAESAVYMVELEGHPIHTVEDCDPHLIIILYGYDPSRSRTMVFPLGEPFFRRPGSWIVTKFLMPQGFFWDDPGWITGQVDNGRVATRFNSDEGITWKERR